MATWIQSLPGKQPTNRSGSLDLFWSGLQTETNVPQHLSQQPLEPVPPFETVQNAAQIKEMETETATRWFDMHQQANGAFDVLAGLYEVPNGRAVRRFLVRRRPLRGLLFDAYPRIMKIFGERVNTELKLIEDMDDNLERLRVSIVSNRDDARQALERFDEEWWLDHVQRAEGLLDFVLRRE